jgi:uncharacterized protein (TIRG00374 family)
MPSARARTGLKYAVSIGLTVLFLYLAFRGTDVEALRRSLAGANYWWMVLNLAVLLVAHVVRAWRWGYLLDPVKPGISLRNLFSGVMIGYFMNNVLPRAGELVRPYAIGRLEGISKSAALGTIVVERIMDTATFLALVALLPLIYDGPLRESFPWLQQTGMVIGLALLALLGVIVTLMLRRDWATRAVTMLEKALPGRFRGRAAGYVHSFLDGFLFLTRPGKFALIFLQSVVIWALYAAMTYLAFFAFGLERQLGMRAALVVLAISSIGVAVPTPGATGPYHFFTSQTLMRLFSVPEDVALSYATVTHAVMFAGMTVVGAYYFLKDQVSLSDAVRRDEGAAA